MNVRALKKSLAIILLPFLIVSPSAYSGADPICQKLCEILAPAESNPLQTFGPHSNDRYVKSFAAIIRQRGTTPGTFEDAFNDFRLARIEIAKQEIALAEVEHAKYKQVTAKYDANTWARHNDLEVAESALGKKEVKEVARLLQPSLGALAEFAKTPAGAFLSPELERLRNYLQPALWYQTVLPYENLKIYLRGTLRDMEEHTEASRELSLADKQKIKQSLEQSRILISLLDKKVHASELLADNKFDGLTTDQLKEKIKELQFYLMTASSLHWVKQRENNLINRLSRGRSEPAEGAALDSIVYDEMTRYPKLIELLSVTFTKKEAQKKVEVDPEGRFYSVKTSLPGGEIELFRVYKDETKSGGFLIRPTSKNRDQIRLRLIQLWDETQNQKGNKLECARRIAEFEFLFMGSGFPGRSAASIGDGLSLTMQLQTGLNFRDQFESIDFNVFGTESEQDYIARRTSELLR